MTTYDFLSAKQAILSKFRTEFNLTQLSWLCFWSTFDIALAQIMPTYEFLRWISCKVAHIMTTYEFLTSGELILSTVRSISNFAYLEWLQPYLSGMAPNFTYLEWLNYHTLMLGMVLFDQQPQRKLSDWGMEGHRPQWFILLDGGAIRPRCLLFFYQNPQLFEWHRKWFHAQPYNHTLLL